MLPVLKTVLLNMEHPGVPRKKWPTAFAEARADFCINPINFGGVYVVASHVVVD
jgi:hypothetical protein